jgi:hypothetical protein
VEPAGEGALRSASVAYSARLHAVSNFGRILKDATAPVTAVKAPWHTEGEELGNLNTDAVGDVLKFLTLEVPGHRCNSFW